MKETLNDASLDEVTGGTDIIFEEDGRVRDTLERKEIELHAATQIPDLISRTIPTAQSDSTKGQ